MNLVLDFGNTRIKAAVFNGTVTDEMHVFSNVTDLLHALATFTTVKNCIIGTVTADHMSVVDFCSSHFNTLVFKSTTPVPLKNLYKSAVTLGTDRLAAAVGSYTLYPDSDVLTIDAGTCIKYNFVNARNEFIGGAISPGLGMRLKAMHHYTRSLPLVEINNSYDKLKGTDTQESLLSGALIGAACEVDEMITRYLGQHPALKVVITGGDSDYLCKQLKNRFFAHQNILLTGLNTILNYQLEK